MLSRHALPEILQLWSKGVHHGAETFVTAVPLRKNTTRSAKKILQGWTAWIIAVRVATTIPAGVRDFLLQARHTNARVAGTATYGCMLF